MNCSPFDLRDYFLKELPAAGAREVEGHLRGCAPCREELDRLRIAEAALLALRDEEIPKRIAFVSDKVFEPSGWRRWCGAFWNSAPRLGFASAAMLSGALLFLALYGGPARTGKAPAVAVVTPVAAVQPAAITEAEITARIQAAVESAMRQSEARQTGKTQQLVADFLRREQDDRKQLVLADETIRWLERRNSSLNMLAGGYRRAGEAQ